VDALGLRDLRDRLPSDLASGLPVGVQLVAADGEDVLLLRVAQAYDRVTRHASRAPSLAGAGA
jgi:Asp-tRNA(Asn)/Glu-tRNA(Gln) amidotransferase A subunit family amidase